MAQKYTSQFTGAQIDAILQAAQQLNQGKPTHTGAQIDALFGRVETLENAGTGSGSGSGSGSGGAQSGIQSSNLSQAQYDALITAGTVEASRWYLIYSGTLLEKIYIGTTLIAQRGVSGSSGFPYSFPIVFGN